MKAICFRNLIVLLFISGMFLTSSCHKEPEVTCLLHIESVSPYNTLSRGDTVTVTISNRGMIDSTNLIIEFGEVRVIPLLNDGRSICFVIPDNHKNHTINIYSPDQGCIETIDVPLNGKLEITSITPSQVNPGDTIKITGYDFLTFPNLGIRLNTQKCSIINFTDTCLVVKIPDNATTNRINIEYSVNSTIASYLVIGPVLKVNVNYVPKIVQKYTYNDQVYTFQRDVLGRATAQLNNGSVIEQYHYAANGLVDSIHYTNTGITKTEAYSRNSDKSVVVVKEIASDTNTSSITYYRFKDEKPYKIEKYYRKENLNDYFLLIETEYIYEDEYCTIKKTFFNEYGEIIQEDLFKYWCDIYNPMPDFGIPGYIYELPYTWVSLNGSNIRKITYDNSGNLIEIIEYEILIPDLIWKYYYE